MNEPARTVTTRERDRALRRLQSITTGTAVVATMATAGFGALAALTWSGTTTTADGATANGTTADPTANARTLGADEDSDTLPTAEAPVNVTPLRPAPTPITTTRKRAQVTSGGSG